jgi:PAS domain S-box-containing protein
MLRTAVTLAFGTCLAWICHGAEPPATNAASIPTLAPLTTIRDVQALSPNETGAPRPVEIEGVVTYYERKWDTLFIQDETGGSYIFPSDRPRPALRAGQRVVVRGRVHPNGPRAATSIREEDLRIVGTGELPEPEQFDFNDLAAGRVDGRWIEVEGIVRVLWAERERMEIDVGVDGGRLRVHLPMAQGEPFPAHLLHARIRVRGACGLDLGERGAIRGVRVFTPELALVRVIESPPDVDEIPTLSIADVPLTRPELVTPSRMFVEGTVSCAATNGPVFMEDKDAGIEISLVESRLLLDASGTTIPNPIHPPLKPGDRIRALGYPAARSSRFILEEAEVTIVGDGTPVLPSRILTPDAIGMEADGRLVNIEGEVLQALRSRNQTSPRRFVLQSSDRTFEAWLANPDVVLPDPGALVQLTGVASADLDEFGQVQGWRVWLRDQDDIQLLAQPWLTFGPETRRLLAIGSTGFVALAGWALFLWRQLGRKRLQTAELETRIAERTAELQRTNADLRHEMAERERAGLLQSAIYRISEATHSVGDLPQLYRQLHEIIGTLMPARNFYIALYDQATGELAFPYFADTVTSGHQPRAWSDGLSEHVIARREPLLATEEHLAELTARGEVRAIGSPMKVWLGVPLMVNNRATGVMAVQDYTDPTALTPEHQRILTYVAGQTAIAIERKRAEAALRSSQEALQASQKRFRSAFAGSPAVMSLSRLRDGVIYEVNEAFLTATGYSREEVIGHSSVELGLWVNPAERDDLVRDIHHEGSVRGREMNIRLRDGTQRTLLMAAELVDIDGEASILAASLDLSERKQVEQQLRRALAKERELGELKSNFVSLVSHEFRTPLEVILSSAEVLERYHDRLGPDHRRRQVGAIQKSVRRMAEMMNEILLLGRFEAGRVEFIPAPLDLPAFQRRVRDEIVAANQARDPQIELHAEGDLSGACGDEGLLGHVFTNLLSNAVKYSPARSLIAFTVRREAREAVFEVRDSGCGIPASDQRRLFQSFHRGSNVGPNSGTGLGLVIVKRCVDRHGGSISFVSREGEGSTFSVRLPLFDEAGGPARQQPVLTEKEPFQPNRRNGPERNAMAPQNAGHVEEP